MTLAEHIQANKDRLVHRWKERAIERLGLDLDHSQLVNDLPEWIDELICYLETPPEEWQQPQGAEHHGQHRLKLGVDVGGLTEEMSLVGETILAMADEDDASLAHGEVQTLLRAIGHGTAASIRAYAQLRDKQLEDQASKHFSFIAHELRSPLQNARLAASLAEMHTGAAGQKHRSQLDRALAQLSDLIDNTLVEARLSSGLAPQRHEADAAELIDEAIADVSAQAEARSLVLTSEADSCALSVDRRLIRSALSNLVGNAIKFTAEGGSVTVRAHARDERILFEVEDECGGMPEDVPPRLFQPFVQGSADKRGFGLGLAIVKQAAEAHGGAARVVNKPGKGCCFILDLPRHQRPDSDNENAVPHGP